MLTWVWTLKEQAFGKVLISSSRPPYLESKNKCSKTRLYLQNEQEIQREGMKLGSQEGGLYPALMFSPGSEVLPSWQRCVVQRMGTLGP